MRRRLLWILVVAMSLGSAQYGWAQKKELKQFVTVSFSGYDDLMKGASVIGKLVGFPVQQATEAQLQMLGAADALNSLDKKRPWIMAVKTDAEGNEFVFQLFIPTSDLKKVLKALPMLGEPADGGEGVLEISSPGRVVFAKQHGDWAVIADSKPSVVDANEDPVKSAGDMPQKYQLGVCLAAKEIPDALKQRVFGLLTMFTQMGVQKMPNETEEQFAARSKMTQQAVQQAIAALTDLERLTVGIKVDDATSSAFFEYIGTFMAGSKTAARTAKSIGAKTSLAGALLPDAAVTFHATRKADPTDIASMKANLATLRGKAVSELDKQGLPEETLKQAKQLAGDLIDVLEKSIETGMMDVAGSVKLGPQTLTLVAGAQIADGKKLESVIKQLVQQLTKDQPAISKFIKLDAEQHQDVRFHVISIPTNIMGTNEQEKMKALVGETLSIIVGIGEKNIFLGAGRDAAKTVKQVIDDSQHDSAKALPPAEFSLAVGAIAKFAASVADANERPTIEMVSKLLEGSAGKDHLKFIVTPVPNGAQFRLVAEEGVLKLLGSIPMIKAGAESK